MRESRKLAEEIARWSNTYQFRKSGGSKEDYQKYLDGEEIALFDDHTYSICHEGMSVCIWKSYPDKARRFCKVVPEYYDEPDMLEKIILAQPWCCI